MDGHAEDRHVLRGIGAGRLAARDRRERRQPETTGTAQPREGVEGGDDLRDGHCISCLLHDVEGLSNHEISALLRVKVGTVRSRVHRARLFLRGRLAGYMTGELGAAPDDSASSS